MLLTALAAFGAGALGLAVTSPLVEGMPSFAQGHEALIIGAIMAVVFVPGIAIAILAGRRLSPEASASQPSSTHQDSEEVEGLRNHLAREAPRARFGLINLVLMLAFVMVGLAGGSVESLVILACVLLFHEAGHALGMLAFGYRDVQVFFLPFFGAAVSGQKPDAPAWQRVVVSLLGPLPGIVLGMVLVLLSGGHGWMGEAGKMAVYINVFNLLPFEPLDGGRVLADTVFSRSRWAEAAFAVAGALALVGIGVATESWLLAVFGGFAIFAVPRRFRMATAAKRIGQLGLPMSPTVETLPGVTLSAMRKEAFVVSPATPELLATQAVVVRELHGRLRTSPPGALATLVLLTAYGGGWLLSLVAVVLTARARSGG